MSLDLPTLFLTSLVVTALLGGFMLVVRYRHRGGVEFAWWGVGYVLLSCGLILLALQERAPSWTAPLGNGLTLGSAGLLWGGTRALGGRPAYLWVVCGGMAIWALASLLPDFATNPLLRLTLRGLLSVLYTSLMAYELWPLRNRDLPLGWVATLWAGFHGLFIGGMTLGAWLIELPPSDAFYDHPHVKLLAFGGVVYVIVLGFLLLGLSTMRSANQHKAAALTDPLTGIANRRAFLEHFRALRHGPNRPRSLALLTFDLDRFKQVNDRFGHLVGDQALQTFAEVATRHLRSRDLIARLGGEEFAAALPNVDAQQAQAIGDRIRAAFALATAELVAEPITVSVGIALCAPDGAELSHLLHAADLALYEAKAQGGNRTVFQAQPGYPSGSTSTRVPEKRGARP